MIKDAGSENYKNGEYNVRRIRGLHKGARGQARRPRTTPRGNRREVVMSEIVVNKEIVDELIAGMVQLRKRLKDILSVGGGRRKNIFINHLINDVDSFLESASELNKKSRLDRIHEGLLDTLDKVELNKVELAGWEFTDETEE